MPSADAEQIAKGHAWSKHQGDFPEFANVDEFAQHIDVVITKPLASNGLARGRRAFWHQPSGTVVIRDPRNSNLGTAFRPRNGKSYFDNLR